MNYLTNRMWKQKEIKRPNFLQAMEHQKMATTMPNETQSQPRKKKNYPRGNEIPN